MKPYEKLSQESDKSWHAFVCYRDLGVDRSTAKVGQRLGKSKTLMDRWSSKNNWVERVAAYDVDQDRIRQTATQKAVAKATEKIVYKQEITAHRILNEQANVAFSRITDTMSWSDIPGLVDSDKLSDEAAGAIESVKIKTDDSGNRTVEVKLWNKHPALARLGEHKKLWGSKEDVTQTQNNFVQFFLDVCKSGELEQEAKRRGIIVKDEGAEVQKS
jgi:hypothetical protein